MLASLVFVITDFPTSVYFKNTMPKAVELFEGSLSRGLLNAYQRAKVWTTVGKIWYAEDLNKKVVMREKIEHMSMNRNDFEYESEYVDCTMEENELRKLLSKGKKHEDATIFKSPYYTGNLFYWNGTCEQYVDTLQMNSEQHVLATHGHAFRLRDMTNSTILSQRVLKDIIIRDNDDDHELIVKQLQDLELEQEILRQHLYSKLSLLNTQLQLLKENTTNETNFTNTAYNSYKDGYCSTFMKKPLRI